MGVIPGRQSVSYTLVEGEEKEDADEDSKEPLSTGTTIKSVCVTAFLLLKNQLRISWLRPDLGH